MPLLIVSLKGQISQKKVRIRNILVIYILCQLTCTYNVARHYMHRFQGSCADELLINNPIPDL